MPKGMSSNGGLHAICVLHLYGWPHEKIAASLGLSHKTAVSRALKSPSGLKMVAEMKDMQHRMIIDPIKQRLEEYADSAVTKLEDLMDADAEAVQLQAAKEILHMAGYTPKRMQEKEKDDAPTIMVGQLNVYQGAGDGVDEVEDNAVTAEFLVEENSNGRSNGEEASEALARIDN